MKPRKKSPFAFRPTLRSSVLSLVCVAGIALLGGYLTVGRMQADLAHSESRRIADHVRATLEEQGLRDVWKDPAGPRSAALFERLAAALRKVEKLHRIKVWDPAGKVIWSDDKRYVGARSTKPRLRRALAGSIGHEFESPGDDPRERERYRGSPVMEGYVPVWREGGREGNRADLVIETYTDATHFFSHLKDSRNRIWTMTGFGGLAVYLLMLGAVRLTSRRLAKEAGRLAALHNLGQRISSSLSRDRVLASITEAAVKLFRGDRASVLLLSDDGKTLRFKSKFGAIPDPPGGVPELPVERSMSGAVVKEGKPLLVKESLGDPRWRHAAWARKQRVRSFMGVPLRRDGRSAGVLTCFSRAANKFQDADLELMEILAAHAAIALENARTYEEIRLHSQRREALRRVAQDIMENLDLETLITRICRSVCELLGVKFTRLLLLDERTETFRRVGAFGEIEGERESLTTFPKGKGIIHRVVSTKAPVAVEEVLRDPDWVDKAWASRAGIRSYLGVPLILQDRVVGVLCCFTAEVREFREDEIDLIEDFGAQATVALQNAKAFENIRRKSAQIAKLSEINRALSSDLNLDRVLEIITTSARELFQAVHCGAYLLDETGTRLTPPAGLFPQDSQHEAAAGLRVGEGVTGRVAEHRESVALRDVRQDPRWVEMPWLRGRPLGGYLGAPLVVGDVLHGVMTCFTEAPADWTPDQIDLFSSFAAQAAVAIRNARLHEGLAASEERHRTLAETACDAVLSINSEGQTIFFNPAAEKLFGYSAEEAVGMSITELIPESSREAHVSGFRRYLQTREPKLIGRTVEVDGLRKDGSVFPMEISVSVAEMNGQLRFNGICRDITERKRAEDSLRESEERLRTLSDAAFEGIVIHDEGRILDANGTFAKMFGYKVSELIGEFGPDRMLAPESRDLVMRNILSGYTKVYEATGLRKDGSTFPMEIRGRSMVLDGNEVRVTAVRDISERKRAEEQLQQTQGQLLHSEKLASVGTLVSGVAHEILNPINALSIKVQMLQQGIGTKDPKKLDENLALMSDNLKRLTKITRNLLDFARRRKPELRSLDIRNVMDQVVDLVEYQYRVTNIEVVREYEETVPEINGDPDQLSQVFLNFLANARDAMPEGGRVTIRIGSRTKRRTPWVRIAIEDTGRGMPEEVLHRVFDPFFTTKGEGEGTGLGLSIAYGIIANHGGRIDVKSAPGKGATFTIDLPADSSP